jgi:hypothetical protein
MQIETASKNSKHQLDEEKMKDKKFLFMLTLLAAAAFVISGCATSASAAGNSSGNQQGKPSNPAALTGNAECEVLNIGEPDYETVLGIAVYTANVSGTCFQLPPMVNSVLYQAPVRNGDLELQKTTDENGVTAYHGDGRGLGSITVMVQTKDGAQSYGFENHLAPAYRQDKGYKLSVVNHEEFNNPAIQPGYYVGCNAVDCRVSTPIQVIPNNPMGKTLVVNLFWVSHVVVDGCGASVVSITDANQDGFRTVTVQITDYCTALTFIVQQLDTRHLVGIVGEAVPAPEE